MTVAEIKKAIAGMDDNEEVIFVEERLTREGSINEFAGDVIAIVSRDARLLKLGWGFERYEREGINENTPYTEANQLVKAQKKMLDIVTKK